MEFRGLFQLLSDGWYKHWTKESFLCRSKSRLECHAWDADSAESVPRVLKVAVPEFRYFDFCQPIGYFRHLRCSMTPSPQGSWQVWTLRRHSGLSDQDLRISTAGRRFPSSSCPSL